MVNFMRYVLILVLFFSANLFAQGNQSFPGPDFAQCSGGASQFTCYANQIDPLCSTALSACLSSGVGNTGMTIITNAPYTTPGGITTNRINYRCSSNCSCPNGLELRGGYCECPAGKIKYQTSYGTMCGPASCPEGQVINIASSGVTCVSDTSEGPPDDPTCVAPQVLYEGFCRDGVASPGDCGSTYSTAVNVSGSYVCTNNGCSSGENQSIFSNASGSWNVCGGDGDGSGNASSGSNTSGSNNSTGGNSSGGNTSSPSSSGGGGDDDSGGPPGTGGGSGGGDGSGNNTSGGAISSTQGGGGTLPTQSSSSVSSGHGAASSGSGAGNCDPTAYNYLDCISQDNPGNGDGTGDAFEPSGGKGEFDGDAAAKRRAELEQQIADEVETIKQEIAQELGGSVRGSGTITDKCISIYGKEVCFGLAKFSGDLAVISQAVFMVVCVICVGIVLRN